MTRSINISIFTLLLSLLCTVGAVRAQENQVRPDLNLPSREVQEQPPVEIKNKKLYKGISMPIPEGFREMSKGEKWLEYPSFHVPYKMYTDATGEADLGFNFSLNQWNAKDLFLLKEFYKANMSYFFMAVEYFKDTVMQVNGKEFVVLEFKSALENKETDRQLPPVKNYTYLMYTVQNGKILVFHFTCPLHKYPKWRQTANAVMDKVAIDVSKLELTDENIAEAIKEATKRYGTPRQ